MTAPTLAGVMGHMKRMWLLTGLFVVLFAGAGVATVWGPSDGAPLRPPAFLRTLAPGGAPFSGVVVEEVPAGGYVYRRIRTDDDNLDWTVALGRADLLGERVTVRPFGLANDFHSARTGRVFDALFFAIVRKQESS